MSLKVFYWPRQNMILVEYGDDLPQLFEAPNLTKPHDARRWLWTTVTSKRVRKEFVEIGEL